MLVACICGPSTRPFEFTWLRVTIAVFLAGFIIFNKVVFFTDTGTVAPFIPSSISTPTIPLRAPSVILEHVFGRRPVTFSRLIRKPCFPVA